MHPAFALANRKLGDCRKEYDLLLSMEEQISPLLINAQTDVAATALSALRASSLESVYTGIEGVLKETLVTADGSVSSTGESWHSRLLAQAAQPTDGRPQIISEGVFQKLDELRAFRHIERNVYKHLLRPPEVEKNMVKLQEVFPLFEEEVARFIREFRFDHPESFTP